MVDLVMRCNLNIALSHRDKTCELLLDSDAVIETVNTGLTPLKEMVGSGLSEVPSMGGGLPHLLSLQLHQVEPGQGGRGEQGV